MHKISPNLSVIAMNINGLKAAVKRQRLSDHIGLKKN